MIYRKLSIDVKAMFRSLRSDQDDPRVVTFEGSVGPDNRAVSLRMTNFDKDSRTPAGLDYQCARKVDAFHVRDVRILILDVT
jgi:hypothetical protein